MSNAHDPARGEHRNRRMLLVRQLTTCRRIDQPVLQAVDFFEQRLPVAQTLDFNSLREPQSIRARIGQLRAASNLPGIVSGPEEAGMLAGPDQWAFIKKGRQIDAGRDAVVSRAEMVEGRGIAGPVVARRSLVEKCPRLRVARQDMVRGDQVIVFVVRQRANECILVRSHQPVGAGIRKSRGPEHSRQWA